jgi:UDP-N-acetylglucosamine 2-epimerase (non-hydrolysing)
MACFGTRPEVIKLAPVIERVEASGELRVVRVATAQHREMLDQTLASFALKPDIDLSLMQPEQELTALAGSAISALGEVLAQVKPSAVMVQGDTTTAFSAAYAAFCSGVPVAHIEAGLRSYDTQRPFPEEVNRRLVTAVSRWNFCPTPEAAENLRREGVAPDTIEVTGNTAVDALLGVLRREGTNGANGGPPKRARHRVLVTLHRRETHGEPQRRLCAMLGRLAQRPDVEVIFPVHLSPAVRRTVLSALEGHPGVHLIDPVDYVSFVHLMRSSDIIVTDSGGVQEEAPSLNVPVVVMRDTTERPEGIAAGCACLAGTDPASVEDTVVRILEDPAERARMASAANPYGEGIAAEAVVARLERDLASGRQRGGWLTTRAAAI